MLTSLQIFLRPKVDKLRIAEIPNLNLSKRSFPLLLLLSKKKENKKRTRQRLPGMTSLSLQTKPNFLQTTNLNCAYTNPWLSLSLFPIFLLLIDSIIKKEHFLSSTRKCSCLCVFTNIFDSNQKIVRVRARFHEQRFVENLSQQSFIAFFTFSLIYFHIVSIFPH